MVARLVSRRGVDGRLRVDRHHADQHLRDRWRLAGVAAAALWVRPVPRVPWHLGGRWPIGVRPPRPRGWAQRRRMAVADRWVDVAPPRRGRPAFEHADVHARRPSTRLCERSRWGAHAVRVERRWDQTSCPRGRASLHFGSRWQPCDHRWARCPEVVARRPADRLRLGPNNGRNDARTTSDSELRIVDVASGTAHTVVVEEPDMITPLGWSPAGDELLYSTSDQAGRTTLWTVNVDGTHRTLVVAGAESGYWQPVQAPKVDRVPASVPPTADPTQGATTASFSTGSRPRP